MTLQLFEISSFFMAACRYINDETIDESEAIEKLANMLMEVFDRDLIEATGLVEEMCIDERNITFDEFIAEQHKVVRKCTCTMAWSKSTLIAKCKQCQIEKNAVVCLPCLLAGDHKEHDVMLRHSKNGSCDCGDNFLWKKSGNCKKHAGQPDHPEEELPRRIRVIFIASSMAIFRTLAFYAEYGSRLFLLAVKWLQRIALIGDAARRCVVIGLAKSNSLCEIFDTVISLSKEDVNTTYTFLGNLVSDREFRKCFSYNLVVNLEKILHRHFKLAVMKDNDKANSALANSMVFMKFMFHGIGHKTVSEYIGTIDWMSILMSALDLIRRFIWVKPCGYVFRRAEPVRITSNVIKLIEIALGQASEEQKREMVQKLTDFMLMFETKWWVSREMRVKLDDVDLKDFCVYQIQAKLISLADAIALAVPPTDVPLRRTAELLSLLNVNLNGCVLDPETMVTMSYALHLLGFRCIGSKNIKEACSEITEDTDLLMKKLCLMPLRYQFVHDLSYSGFFVRNTDEFLDTLTYLKASFKLKCQYFPMFRLIQSCLMNVDDKHSFVVMIASIAGVLHEQKDFLPNEKNAIMFIFMHFVCCMIYDRLILNNDEAKMRRLAIMTMLKIDPMSVPAICKIWPDTDIYDDEFIADLMSYAERMRSEKETLFRLSDSSEWHPLIPYVASTHVSTAMARFTCKNPSSLIPFPELPPELKTLLVDPLLLAVSFVILQNPESGRETIQLVLNLFVDASREYPEDERKPEDVIEASGIADLAEKLTDIKFKTFVHTKIAYEGKNPVSIFDLLVGMGELGHLVISRMNLSIGEVPQSTSEVTKKRAEMLRKRVMQNFITRQNSFNDADPVEESDENLVKCPICHCKNETDFLVYPALVCDTSIPFIHHCKKRGVNPLKASCKVDKMVKICIHGCHEDCQNFSRSGYCAIDRCPFNTGLPLLDGMSMEAIRSNDNVMRSVHAFLKKLENPRRPTWAESICQLAVQLQILDLRYRRNPRCLDEPAVAILLRNFWLCIVAAYENECTAVSNVDDMEMPLFEFILWATIAYHTEDVVRTATRACSLMVPEHLTVYELLRCVTLFEHFCLLHDVFDGKTKDRDWDEVLSRSNLFKKFHELTEEKECELCNFSLINLPKNFLGFLESPFSIDIANNDDFEIVVELMTGEVGVIPQKGVRVRNMKSVADILRAMGNTFSMFLVVTGARATSVLIGSMEFNYLVETKSCYVDKFGDEDKGFQIGRFVSPSPDRLEWLTDQLLSGNWSNAVKIPN